MVSKKTSRPLPDSSKWQPRDVSRKLSAVLEKQCQNAEERILRGLRHETEFSVDSFDAGLPFEGMVRQEIKQFLPQRYAIGNGLLLDRNGRTAGKCDVVVFNNVWFSPVKSPASNDAGQPYIPIEGVYAVGEVKQRLSARTLDEAMEKLVTCHRLDRPRTFAHRLVENREGNDCPHGLTNPLVSFIVAGSIAESETFQSIMERFYDICRSLKRLEVVHILCVLGQGVLFWGFRDPRALGELRRALFLEDDLFHPIFPMYLSGERRNPFYSLIEHLQQALFHIVLGPEDVPVAYSFLNTDISVPRSSEIVLAPDDEWVNLLAMPCRDEHK